MIATKYCVEIKIQALSKDSVPGLLYEVIDFYNAENTGGKIQKDDGDESSWKTTQAQVEF